MTGIGETSAVIGYGARPVSVDLTRGRALAETRIGSAPGRVAVAPPAPARDRNAYERLSLKHWPRGHRLLVCSLTGGTGRTTVAALIATTLAGLPYAEIWPPALLVDGAPRRVDPSRPWHGGGGDPPGTLVGSQLLLRIEPGIKSLQPRRSDGRIRAVQMLAAVTTVQQRFAPVIIDDACRPPSDSAWTAAAPAGVSVCLLVRPDEHSLTTAAEALVWMHNRHLVTKQQVTVVVNHGTGTPTRRSRAAAAALTIRCHGLHHLPADPHLGPEPIPPAERSVPQRLQLRLAQICLDIWHTSQTPNPHQPGPTRSGVCPSLRIVT